MRRCAFFKSLGEHYKARDHRQHPGRGADQPLRAGRLGRPVPRPARALDRQAQGFQAHEGRRRLLARRFAQRDAAADLRHRLGRTRSSSMSTCTGSRRPRSAITGASAASSICSTCRKRRPGAVFWHPEGLDGLPDPDRLHARAAARRRLRGGERARSSWTSRLWEQSGHLEKFGENMFLTETPDERVYAIKPMNCPGHVQIFKHGLRSYRELPVRLAEFGKVHRYEPSGALHGLMRVRAFTQDDAHVFVTEEQITAECGRHHPADPRHLSRFRLRGRAHQVRRPAAEARRRAMRSGTGPKRR